MPRGYKFSTDNDDIIIKMYMDNFSIDEIAEKVGLSSYLVTKRCKQLNLPKRDNHKVIEACNLRKYGYKYPFQNIEVQQKVRDNIKEKYNVNNVSQLESVKKKTLETKLARFGKVNNSQTPEWKQQHDKTCLEKFGATNNSKTDEWLQKTKQTNIVNYGYQWYTQSDKYKQSKKKICISKYGVEDFNQQNIKHYEDYNNLEEWTKDYLKVHSIITPSIVAKYFNVRFGYCYKSNT